MTLDWESRQIPKPQRCGLQRRREEITKKQSIILRFTTSKARVSMPIPGKPSLYIKELPHLDISGRNVILEWLTLRASERSRILFEVLNGCGKRPKRGIP